MDFIDLYPAVADFHRLTILHRSFLKKLFIYLCPNGAHGESEGCHLAPWNKHKNDPRANGVRGGRSTVRPVGARGYDNGCNAVFYH